MAMFSRKQSYEVAPQNDQDSDISNLEFETRRHSMDRKTKLLWYLGFIMLAVNSILASMLIIRTFKTQELSKESSILSKSFDTITKQINGTLWPTDNPSWSRLASSPEVDDIWEFYEPIWVVPLSKSDVMELGKDPATAAQFPSDWGMVAGSYIGTLDVFHKMHCLNELRRMTFEGYPRDNMTNTRKHHSTLQWIHLRHCVDLLAQDIQCNARMDINTWNWVDTQTSPMPDFSVYRSCTNWDQFLDWSIKNTLSLEKFDVMRRPTDKKPIPAERGYYETYGFGGSDLFPDGKGYNGRP